MLLRYFYDEELAQASYLVGCAATGEALVIDPLRDVEPYLREAAKAGMRISHVTETHIHADFVSGVRELASRTGATMYLSDMGDANWKYGYADPQQAILIRDGDHWMVGNIKVEVIATPGHTLEHIAFQITDTAATNQPLGVFTGDFLFVGDIGRPDLLEEAAGFVGTKEPGARMQYDTVARFKSMPDYLQVWPAHGAGSACGKALGAIPSSTLGYEKRINPAFQFEQKEQFVHWLLDGQPEAPWYFARMKHVNKVGPALLSELKNPEHVSAAAVEAAIADGAQVFDLRPKEQFVAGHLPGSLSVPATTTMFNMYAGWFINYTKPLYLVVNDAAELPGLLRSLRAIGIDDVPGFILAADLQAATQDSLPTISLAELSAKLEQDAVQVIDVRGKTEYDALHLPGAINIPLGHLVRRQAEIPTNRPIVMQCASGYRSNIGASVLRQLGYQNVATLVDPNGNWKELAAQVLA